MKAGGIPITMAARKRRECVYIPRYVNNNKKRRQICPASSDVHFDTACLFFFFLHHTRQHQTRSVSNLFVNYHRHLKRHIWRQLDFFFRANLGHWFTKITGNTHHHPSHRRNKVKFFPSILCSPGLELSCYFYFFFFGSLASFENQIFAFTRTSLFHSGSLVLLDSRCAILS